MDIVKAIEAIERRRLGVANELLNCINEDTTRQLFDELKSSAIKQLSQAIIEIASLLK